MGPGFLLVTPVIVYLVVINDFDGLFIFTKVLFKNFLEFSSFTSTIIPEWEGDILYVFSKALYNLYSPGPGVFILN